MPQRPRSRWSSDRGRHVTRSGAVVRADTVRNLSDAGWAALIEYGITRIVDLRFHGELAADPRVLLPVEVVHIPLLPEDDSEHWPEIDALADAALDATAAQRTAYLEFIKRFPKNFALAISCVADAPPGGVLVHCLSGKDRTGLVAALLLRLADVPVDVVAADYSLSADNLSSRNEQWIAEATDETERWRRQRICATPAECMVGVLEDLEHRYGGARDFLLAAGAGEAALDRARARLRD